MQRIGYDMDARLAAVLPLEAFSKPSIGLKVKAGVSFKPEEYSQYFEDLNDTPNTVIEFEGRF